MVRHAVALALATLAGINSAVAGDFKLGPEIEGRVSGAATFGTAIRTQSPEPRVYGATASTQVPGAAPGELSGNGGANDLNFQKNHPVSTVLKGFVDLELKRRNVGIFVRAKAWYDFELEDGDRAYGNTPNGYAHNRPLSDAGFDPEAKFSNARLADVYGFGTFKVGDDIPVEVRAGRQAVYWGTARFVAGGINVITPVNVPGRVRPGALPEEGYIPVGALYADLGRGKQWGVDGFLQLEFRPNVAAPCGTFYNTSNFSPPGCNYASVVGNIPDPVALQQGLYPHRLPDVNARDSGQFGLSTRYTAEGLRTDFRVYAMNYHSRSPSIRATNANIAGGYGSLATFTRLTDPNGLKYQMIYPEDIQLYGLSFATRLDRSTRVYGELAYRPNQPLNMNAQDLIQAFLQRSPNSLLNLARNTNAIPPGGAFDAYDRFKVTTATLGSSKAFPGILGAPQLELRAEVGLSHVSGLPDPGVMRYGRFENYGGGAVNGVPCVDTTVAQKACAHDGFITTNAWGYRVRIAADYPEAFAGATLTPSLVVAHDVNGYSYDGTFLKGRVAFRPAIRAEWPKKYFAEIQYVHFNGGAYNLHIDRDTLAMAVGVFF
jgi:hypothetical protein